MAKIDLLVTLKKDNGTVIGTTINVVNQPTKSAADAAVGAVIQARVDAAAGASADILEAQTAFNS